MQFQPLRITAYTVCSAAGDGCEQTLDALRERRSGLTRNDFGATPVSHLRLVASPDSRSDRCLPRSPTGTAATTGWRGEDSNADRFIDAVARRARALRCRSGRRRRGHLDIEHRRERRRVSTPRARRSLSRRPAPPDHSHAAFARRFRPARARPHGHQRDRRNRVLVERQGLRAGRAPDSPGSRRCGRRRRRRYAVRQRPVRFQLARAGVAGSVPAVRRRASRHQSRRGRRLRAARARRRRAAPGCSATANRATRTTCRRRIPKASARARRSRMRSSGRASDAGDIDYINLHGTASLKNDEVGGESRRRHISGDARSQVRPRAGRDTRSARLASSKRRSA